MFAIRMKVTKFIGGTKAGYGSMGWIIGYI